jgi:XTP/dITP diphosphohydrolase
MIKKIIFATSNRHKVEEMKAILKDLDIEIVPMISFMEYPKIIENGATFEENAVKKARKASDFFGKWTIADDSGLEVNCLNSAPGIYSSRYAGEGCSCDDNNKKLLAALEGIPQEKRTSRFKTVIALSDPDGKRIYLADGEIFGTITMQFARAGGFGYDSVFYIPEYGGTFSSLGPKIKNSISHRAKALHKIKKIIKSL